MDATGRACGGGRIAASAAAAASATTEARKPKDVRAKPTTTTSAPTATTRATTPRREKKLRMRRTDQRERPPTSQDDGTREARKSKNRPRASRTRYSRCQREGASNWGRRPPKCPIQIQGMHRGHNAPRYQNSRRTPVGHSKTARYIATRQLRVANRRLSPTCSDRGDREPAAKSPLWPNMRYAHPMRWCVAPLSAHTASMRVLARPSSAHAAHSRTQGRT